MTTIVPTFGGVAVQQNKQSWPRFDPAILNRAVEGRYYIKVDPAKTSGKLQISGADARWKKGETQDYMYLPDLRLAGHPADLTMYLEHLLRQNIISQDTYNQSLQRAYTRQSVASNQDVKQRYEAEIQDYEAFKQATGRPAKMELPIPIEALPFLAKMVKGKAPSRDTGAGGQTGRGGRGNIVKRIMDAINQNRTSPGQEKVIDITDLDLTKDTGSRQKNLNDLPKDRIVLRELALAAKPAAIQKVQNVLQRVLASGVINEQGYNQFMQWFQSQAQSSQVRPQQGMLQVPEQMQQPQQTFQVQQPQQQMQQPQQTVQPQQTFQVQQPQQQMQPQQTFQPQQTVQPQQTLQPQQTQQQGQGGTFMVTTPQRPAAQSTQVLTQPGQQSGQGQQGVQTQQVGGAVFPVAT